ncbi:kinase-like domain-containing protein, partial [Baffinella frigidus]
MRKTGGKIVIVDFGLSKSDSNGSATMAGTFTGTIAYSAPEQIKTSNVSYSADVFALAIIFYEAVSGCLPFSSRGDTGSSTSQRSTIAVLDNPYASTIAALDNPYAVSKYTTAVVEGTAMPLEEVPQEVRAFIDRCFTKAPAKRPADAGVMSSEWDEPQCFTKAPEKRPADAGVMLAEWDEAAAAAETAILQKAQGTDADVFWSTKFDDAPSIDSELFSAAMLAEFKMDSAASLRVEKAMDEDANGEISRAEWAAFIKAPFPIFFLACDWSSSEEKVADVIARFAAPSLEREEKVADVVARFAAPSPEEEAKGAEPAGVFLEKYKDYGPISFTSNGSFLGGFGGKKQRTGCLKLG